MTHVKNHKNHTKKFINILLKHKNQKTQTKNLNKDTFKKKNKKNRTEQNLTYRENYTILFYFILKHKLFFLLPKKLIKIILFFFIFIQRKNIQR